MEIQEDDTIQNPIVITEETTASDDQSETSGQSEQLTDSGKLTIESPEPDGPDLTWIIIVALVVVLIVVAIVVLLIIKSKKKDKDPGEKYKVEEVEVKDNPTPKQTAKAERPAAATKP